MEPILPLWLPLPKLLKSQKAKKKLHRVLGGLIQERRAQPAEPVDFLQTLIEARFSDGTPIDEEMIINLILLLVWAGHETTANGLAWAWYILSERPDVERRLFEEVHGLLKVRAPTFEDLKAMPYNKMVFEETIRLFPPAPAFLRKAIGPDRIGPEWIGGAAAGGPAGFSPARLPGLFPGFL